MGPSTRWSTSRRVEEPQNVTANEEDSATATSKSKESSLRIDIDITKDSNEAPQLVPTPSRATKDEQPTTHTPSKKRRRDDQLPSPPWKEFKAEAPSNFTDADGRKRSTRTNRPPAPETPDVRKTRSAIARSEEKKPTPSNVKSSSSHRKVTSDSHKAKPSSAPRDRATSTTSTYRTSNRSGSRNTYGKEHSIRSGGRNNEKTPSRTNGQPAVSTRHSQRRRTSTHQRGQASVEAGYDDEGDREAQSEEGSEAPSELDDGTGPRISVRLTFSRRVKPPVVGNHGNLPAPRKFASLREMLEAEKPMEEQVAAMEEEALAEAMKRIEVEDAIEDGTLNLDSVKALPLAFHQGPEKTLRQWSHADHLIAHAIRFNKLLKMERVAHIRMAKNIAKEASEAAIKKMPKTAAEIERERMEQTLDKYKNVMAQFLVQMKAAEQHAQGLRLTQFVEMERAQGREKLSKMLKHSSTLLGARIPGLERQTSEQDGSAMDINEDDEDEDEDEDEDDDEDDDDESNMSESEESEDEAEVDVVGDDDLSPEELRKKYAELPQSSDSEPTFHDADDISMLDVNDLGTDSDVGTDVDNGGPSLDDDDDDEQIGSISDEDIPMDSEDDDDDMHETSDEEEFEGESDDDDGNEEEEEVGGLMGFFSKADRPPVPTTVDDEVDEDDEDDLSEVGVVPVNDGKSSPNVRSSPTVYQDADTSLDPTDLASHQLRADGKAYSEQEVQQSADESTMEDVAEEADTRNAQSTTSESSLQKQGLSGTSAVTTPASIGVVAEGKEEAKTPIPSLLRGTLREYQHHGLDWLAGLYENGTNGILADEMGLGKTIQTISLISHLATAKGVWGPHLVVVPTSVILNWEIEFKKFAPGFKILTYYGDQEARKKLRVGWMNDDKWNVCITSYQIVVQDAAVFRRRQWHYYILDEAHHIKNFRSQRWQTLLNFKASARLLITGTPLQNNLIELWSLLYFLMPSGGGMSAAMPAGFTDLDEFQKWFSHPVDQLLESGREGMDEEAKDSIRKLHGILRPFLLRRLKKDVEKQMPGKYEHIVWCHLSKRQRFLYDEFMSRAQTKETLVSGHYLSIINCLMQLRKVCNHPDLFETRQIVTSFAMDKSVVSNFVDQEHYVRERLFKNNPFEKTDLGLLNLNLAQKETLSTTIADRVTRLTATRLIRKEIARREQEIDRDMEPDYDSIEGMNNYIRNQLDVETVEKLKHMVYMNELRTNECPLYGSDVRRMFSGANESIIPASYRTLESIEANQAIVIRNPGLMTRLVAPQNTSRSQYRDWLWQESTCLHTMVPTLQDRASSLDTIIQKFGCVTPTVVATDMPQISLSRTGVELSKMVYRQSPAEDPFHRAQNRLSIAFPDKRLLQYDCGKLQKLDELLRTLQAGGHRALIFTQMTKVLDILEQFLNIHGHKYLRLDGATKIEQRQVLTERFNSDPRILVFILSTRSGGLGINLTGADSVIFYDLDWNPAMDKQCQDRCHRIGQTRDVHIYRFVSEFTIESNILRKSNQKQMLDDVVIQEGEFTVDKFNRLTVADLFGDDAKKLGLESIGGNLIGGGSGGGNLEQALAGVEDAEDVAAAKVAEKEDVDVMDRQDFDQSVPKEGARIPIAQEATGTEAEAEDNTGMNSPLAGGMEDEEEEEAEDDVGSLDDYLKRLWLDLLKDEPIAMPKRNKNGKRDRSKKGRRP